MAFQVPTGDACHTAGPHGEHRVHFSALHPPRKEPMLRFLASGFITRKLAGRIARLTPNPLLRTVGVAVAGYAVNRALSKRRPARRLV